MVDRNVFLKILIIFMMGLFVSCTMTTRMNNQEEKKIRMNKLVRIIAANPSVLISLRVLCVFLVKSHYYKRGILLLERALRLNTKIRISMRIRR